MKKSLGITTTNDSGGSMAETDGPSQDMKMSNIPSVSDEIDCESISLNTVKKVRFSEYIDYCDFYPFENDIDATSQTKIGSEKCEINELTDEITSLDISSSLKEVSLEIENEHAQSENSITVNDDFNLTEDGKCNESVVLQENNFSGSLSQKRISKFTSRKQTKRLNDLLRKNSNDFRAKDFKAVVFKAWTNVKRGTKENQPNIIPSKSDGDSSDKSNIAFTNWKNSKAKQLKYIKKRNEKKFHSNSVQNQEINKEENDMVFLSWRKRKDEQLKQEALNRKRDERNAAEIELMNKEEKQRDGEYAFQAWKAHKDQNKKEEKKKMLFYKEREKEAIKEKESRNLEAQHMYELWVEYKCSRQSKMKGSSFNIQLPWYPPGN